MKRFALLFLITVLLASCEESERDQYFESPQWLESPIYSILEETGHFKNYLQCVDSTSYASVLKGAGLFTVFAPNDSAFRVWMDQKGYSSVGEIPKETIESIVDYSIVYSKWPFDKLSYRFENKEYVPGAFKRKTTCYSLPYQDPDFDNNWVFDETMRGGLAGFMTDDKLNLTRQNYKFLPIYTYDYFNSQPSRLSDVDYNTFYPDVTFTGKNVQGGVILNKDIIAENGIIHEVSAVNMPMDNIENILKSPQFSFFNSLLNYKSVTGKYLFKYYTDAEEITPRLLQTFQNMLPNANISKVYLKSYSGSLGISPVMENILSETGSNISEMSGNTFFIPTNDVLDNYVKSKILKYYGDLSAVPQDVLVKLLNTHMAEGMIWPTLYEESKNSTEEYLNGEGRTGKKFAEAGILDKKMGSNGIVYQIDHVIKSRYFETVYSEIFLNPAHLLLNLAYTEALRENLMKSPLNGYLSERWTVLNFPDELLTEDGFGYDNLNNAFTHKDGVDVGSYQTRLQRLINMHIFPGLINSEINSFVTGFSATPPLGASNYGGWGYLVNNYGDLIRYKNGQLQAAGNIEDKTYVTVTKQDDVYNNGEVYNVDNLLQYSPRNSKTGTARYTDMTLWTYLDRARKENTNVKTFVDYVEKCIYNASTGALDGIKPEYFYTVLMPSNAAMTSAVNDGYLPPLANVTPDSVSNLAKATKFVNAHFLQGQVIPDDGLKFIYPVNPQSPDSALCTTLLKVTDEKLELVNKSTLVKIKKVLSGGDWKLQFEPQDIKLGNTLQVDGAVGKGTVANITGVNRGRVSASAPLDNCRSNRIACKAVLHEIGNYIRFTPVP